MTTPETHTQPHFDQTSPMTVGHEEFLEPRPSVCPTCNGTGKEARHQICRDCDELSDWRLVHRTPTDGMMRAGLYQSPEYAEWSDVYSIWVDMVDASQSQLDATAVNSCSALQARVAELEKALKFYADAWCFTTHPKRPGLEWKPKEDLLDDCGNIARAALQGGSNG